MENACSGTKDVVILGDANICASKWLEEDYHGKDLADKVRKFLLENDCNQMVTDYTRTEVGRGGVLLNSCIDHVYSNCPEKIQTSVCHVGDSDHAGFVVEKTIRLKRCKPNVVKKRSYKSFNVQSFLTDINTSDINRVVVEEKDVNKAAEIFEKKV